ncbi:nestin isoform X2 [Hippocampus comes]|uniref:nestin isoform X2 n=1 Tax=Hippocampus comes TaxID=109280 RepID=UPI00094EFECD|nr:PREDICTED: nestin isoform X2 [Hippocampus comes]
MDLHPTAHYRHMAQEKHQMLDLNRRLQSYLGRVKLLEEENTMLSQEIQAQRHGHHGASVREKSLKEDLHRARAELDKVWRERVYTEMEVCKLSEEIQMVERHCQKEALAQAEIKAKMEVSRKELEEEHGAQRWLRERIKQLEEEMDHRVRNHEADVAHLETMLSHSIPPRTTPNLDLLQLEQELSQQASRAWHETAEAYQAQLDQLEESLRETAARLGQAEHHKNEYQAHLRALERDRISEGDVRRQLEETAEQQREEHRQHINTLQEHWECLEKEKEHLGQQLDRLVQENRGLLQQKMSLGLEVVTYRALLDGESLRRDDVSLLKDSRNITLKDMPVKPSRGNYQLPGRCNTLASVRRAPITSTTPLRSKPVNISQARGGEETATMVAKQESPYPKILYDGAVEKFRAQEVDEKVTYAEPLSSPVGDEHEQHPAERAEEEYGGKSEDKASFGFQVQSGSPKSEGLESRIIEEKNKISHCQSSTQEPKSELLGMTAKTFSSSARWNPEQQPTFPVEEKAANGFQLQPGVLPLTTEITEYQSSAQEPTSDLLVMTEKTFSSTAGSDQKQSPCVLEEKATVAFEIQSEAPPRTEEIHQQPSGTQELDIVGITEETISSSAVYKQELPPCVPVAEETAVGFQLQSGAQLEPCTVEDEQEQTSSSGTEALLEPTLESRTSSPSSENEFNPIDVSEIKQEISYSTLGTTATEAVDMLYPDGEEMDTWDSVIEKKIHVESSEPKPEAESQFAKPEEDILTRRSELSRGEMKKQDDEMWLQREESSQHSDDKGLNEEDEDSQNISVSWRTELESDSYAQENTLADVRPLIRYTSDETDANTQASHVDESESSDGEQDGQTGEVGEPAWSESKAKNFGTMEDLCEEVDEEVVENDKKYSQEASGLEKSTLKISEGHLDEEVPAAVDDVELETDQLVEQELENLSIDSYACHFAEEVANESQAVLPEDEEEAQRKVILKQEVITDIQVTHNLDFRDSMQPQRLQEVQEEDVHDGMMTKEQDAIPESDVQVESNLDLRDSVQPQTLEEVEVVEVQDRMMKMREELIKETELKIECNQVLRDSAQPQVDSPNDDAKGKVEEREVQDHIMTTEQEVIMEFDTQVECNQDIRNLVSPQVDTMDHEKKVQDEMMTMEYEEAGIGLLPSGMDSDVQVEDDQDRQDSIPPQVDTPEDDEEKGMEEKEVQDELTAKEQETIPESDVQVESKLDLKDSVQPQTLEEVEQVEVQDGMMKMGEEFIKETELKVECDQVHGDSVQTQLDSAIEDAKEKVEESEVQERIITMEQEVTIESAVQVEPNQDIRSLVPPQMDTMEDEEKVQDEIMRIEHEEAGKGKLPFCMDSDVQVEDDLDLEDSIPPQLHTPDDEKKGLEEKEVQHGTLGQEETQEVPLLSCTESDVQVEHNLNLVQPQLDSPDDGEKVQDEIMTTEQEVSKESAVQVEHNQDIMSFVPPQIDTVDDKEKVENEIMSIELTEADKGKLPSCMDPDVQIDDDLDPEDSIPPQMDTPDDDEKKGIEEKEVQHEMLGQKETQEVPLLSCTESDVQVEHNLNLVQPQLDSPDDEEKVQDEIMPTEQEEADKVSSPSYMDPDFQVEGNLDLSDFIPPQVDSPDDHVKEVQEEILKQEEAQKVYLQSCMESEVRVERSLNLVQPQLDSPDDGEKVQDKIMTTEQEEANKLNVPSCVDPDTQVEDDLDLREFVQPLLDSPDDYLEEVQDITLNQQDAVKVNLPVSGYLQDEDMLRQDIQDSLEAPEKRKDEFESNVSMVTHADETYSEFLRGLDFLEEAEEELLEKPQRESQNQKGLLQEYTYSVGEDDASILAEKWNILENTSEDVDIRHPKDEAESHVSHLRDEVGDGELAATFGEKPVEISLKTAPEEAVIFAMKDSLSEFLKTNDRENQNLWAALPADKWNVPENVSEDVNIRHPKNEEECGLSHGDEEAGDGESAPKFDEKHVAISPETATEESIFAVKDSLTEFRKTNVKDKRDLWVSSMEEAAAYGSDDIPKVMSGIHDVEFGSELDWGKAVNGSSARDRAGKKEEHVTGVSVHSEESEVEGECWSSGDE